ncbi:MAG TPA: polyprenyl synthetase family protein [Pyrinomonadaceae bacterium]|nr:polyprenyl synthetase family protein [Pyrinomonadaceae bacterium]
MSERLNSFLNTNRGDIEAELRARLPVSSLPAASRLNDALEYALFPGGKRLRPALSLLASTLTGVPRAEALTIACAVEFLHSSSIVIDDLPGMDDAHLRRNRYTLHLVFGEGTALLAALALLNQSYKLFAEAARSHACAGAVERLISEATYAVGAEGMIGGQMLDLELKADCSDTRSLAGRDLKTVALMRLMMTAGAIATGADDADTRALRVFGECFGKAYQVCDDLLDECRDGHSSSLKTVGQDARHGRANAVSALGRRGAYRLALELTERGTHALTAHFGRRAEVQLLSDAAHYVIDQVPDLVTAEDYSLTAVSAGD